MVMFVAADGFAGGAADETAAFLPGATGYGAAARGDCCASWHTSTRHFCCIEQDAA